MNEDQQKFMDLYNQLEQFRKNNDFKKYGLGKGGPHYTWLITVLSFYDKTNCREIINELTFIDLRTLAVEYMRGRRLLSSHFIRFFVNNLEQNKDT